MRTKEGNKEKDIIEAAIKVFAREGYHSAKMTKIADAADVSTGTVYLYYESKEDILLEIFKQLWLELSTKTQAMVHRKDINSLGKLEGMIDLLFDMFASNPSLAIVFVNEQNQLVQRRSGDFTPLYEKYLDLAQQVLQEGIKGRTFNPSIELNVIRQFVFGGVRNLIHQWAQDPKEYPLNMIRVNVKSIMKNGILRPGK
jgi:TetR/AcrR family transcriptional regulator, fatty acid metabolism regulator protein